MGQVQAQLDSKKIDYKEIMARCDQRQEVRALSCQRVRDQERVSLFILDFDTRNSDTTKSVAHTNRCS